jgi:drug/metabolite transporter (DMT)-like permease
MDRKQLFKGYIFIILSALIFGLMPLMAKYVYADGVTPATMVLFRNLFSMPVLALLALASKSSIKPSPKELPKISLIAIMGCCLTPLLLFSSYNYIPSGTATVFHFIYPAAVVIGELIFFKNKLGYGRMMSVIMCVGGIALFYDPSSATDPLGSMFALLSGLTYAIYIILLAGYKNKERSVFAFSFFVSAISTVVMLAVCLLTDQLSLPRSLFGWCLAIFFALIVNVGAVVLFQRGTFLIGGSRASVLSTLEPITSVFAGVLFMSEKINVFTLIGTLLVIAASVLIALCDIKPPKNNIDHCTKE